MSITVQYHEVTDDHLGFTSARHNADGSVTIFYGDEPKPEPVPKPIEVPAVVAIQAPDPKPATLTLWQRIKSWISA